MCIRDRSDADDLDLGTDGQLYVTTGRAALPRSPLLRAVRPDGTIAWTRHGVVRAAAGPSGHVFTVASAGTGHVVTLFDAAGNTSWEHPLPDAQVVATVSTDRSEFSVYGQGASGHVSNDSGLWVFSVQGLVAGPTRLARPVLNDGSLIDTGHMFAYRYGSTLVAVSRSGNPLWETPVSDRVGPGLLAAADDGTLFINGRNGVFASFSASGALRWSVAPRDFGMSHGMWPPRVTTRPGLVTLATLDRGLYLFDAQGVLTWRYSQSRDSGEPFLGATALYLDGMFYAARRDHVFAFAPRP